MSWERCLYFALLPPSLTWQPRAARELSRTKRVLRPRRGQDALSVPSLSALPPPNARAMPSRTPGSTRASALLLLLACVTMAMAKQASAAGE